MLLQNENFETVGFAGAYSLSLQFHALEWIS